MIGILSLGGSGRRIRICRLRVLEHHGHKLRPPRQLLLLREFCSSFVEANLAKPNHGKRC